MNSFKKKEKISTPNTSATTSCSSSVSVSSSSTLSTTSWTASFSSSVSSAISSVGGGSVVVVVVVVVVVDVLDVLDVLDVDELDVDELDVLDVLDVLLLELHLSCLLAINCRKIFFCVLVVFFNIYHYVMEINTKLMINTYSQTLAIENIFFRNTRV